MATTKYAMKTDTYVLEVSRYEKKLLTSGLEKYILWLSKKLKKKAYKDMQYMKVKEMLADLHTYDV